MATQDTTKAGDVGARASTASSLPASTTRRAADEANDRLREIEHLGGEVARPTRPDASIPEEVFDPMAALVDLLVGIEKASRALSQANPSAPAAKSFAELVKTCRKHLARAGVELPRPGGEKHLQRSPYQGTTPQGKGPPGARPRR